ncbi:hypothetical protein [Sphingobacterium cellulitidis]|uniref:hypothetical protein n=1 Tax=Sphingobacterium cellulitidis TaxID=1768011 RepID=UPI000B93F151|nr:hypothetical protein CHT99_10240 [Sphingobacterium cellulitidis]
MGEIEKKYLLSEEDIRTIVIETISLYKQDEVLAKPQLIFKEACKYYGEIRVRKWIKSGLLKPQSQNGKGSKKYYSHKQIIKLSQEFRHYLPGIKL